MSTHFGPQVWLGTFVSLSALITMTSNWLLEPVPLKRAEAMDVQLMAAEVRAHHVASDLKVAKARITQLEQDLVDMEHFKIKAASNAATLKQAHARNAELEQQVKRMRTAMEIMADHIRQSHQRAFSVHRKIFKLANAGSSLKTRRNALAQVQERQTVAASFADALPHDSIVSICAA